MFCREPESGTRGFFYEILTMWKWFLKASTRRNGELRREYFEPIMLNMKALVPYKTPCDRGLTIELHGLNEKVHVAMVSYENKS